MTAPSAAPSDAYIQQRLRAIFWWNRLGWLVLALLAAVVTLLYQQNPLYFDPMLVAQKAQSNQLPSAQMAQLAALGTLALWGCVFLMVGLVLQAYVSAYHEKRLIAHYEQRLADAQPSATANRS